MPFLEVLCPNGRRVKVSVSPNSTIQQVLEEACQSQNLLPSNYYLRHNRKTLDLSTTFRFSNLINMAKLELVPLQSSEGKVAPLPNSVPSVPLSSSGGGDTVKVAVHIATTGHRVILPSVEPSTTLYSILEQCAREDSSQEICVTEDSDFAPMLLYVTQKIAGEKALRSCTLSSLGVLKGSALLRYEKLPTSEVPTIPLPETRVLTPFAVPPPSFRAAVPQSSNDMQINEPGPTYEADVCTVLPQEVPMETTEWPARSVFAAPTTRSMFLQERDAEEERKRRRHQQQKKSATLGEIVGISFDDLGQSSSASEPLYEFADFKFPEKPATASEENSNQPSDCDFDVDRQAIWFDYNAVPAVKREDEDIPDEIYEVTEADVRSMVATYRAMLEDKPLLTEAQRQTERERLFSKYTRCILHFQLANRLTLQCLFHPRETLGKAFQFLKEQLPGLEVQNIYTAPPKKIFSKSQFTSTLLELNLVPMSKIYVSLKDAGELDAVKSRIVCCPYEEALKIVSSLSNHTSNSTEGQMDTAPISQSQTGRRVDATPKWFKPPGK